VHAARYQARSRDWNVGADGLRLACRIAGRPLHPLRRARTAGIWSSGAIAGHGPRRTGRSRLGNLGRQAGGDPKQAELLLQEADEAAALKAVEQLKWSSPPHYYMFARKISGWSKAEEVQTDISDI
jgi:hypothetical protein